MSSKKIYHKGIWMVGLIIIGLTNSCKKMVEVKPVGSIPTSVAYSTEANIAASVNGIYYTLQQQGTIYNSSYNSIFPLLSDEASIGNTSTVQYLQFGNSNITSDNYLISGFWSNCYATIYQANLLLENVSGNTAINATNKNQWLGEARFLRAYSYFILTQYFGKVPLATTSDYKTNNSLARSDTATVNKFIISELEAAATLLPDGYSAYNNNRTRACKQTAQALLAREYLYRGDWAKAEANATLLINNSTFSLPGDFNNALVSNSVESIWEIAFSQKNQNYTAYNLVPFGPYAPPVVPSTKLVNAFETGDKRKDVYLELIPAAPSFYIMYKWHDQTNLADQPKILRLSEMYLIRAEARLNQNNLSGAAQDINAIRNRAGLANTTATTQANLMSAVMQERFVELCFEGDRWLDLIRTGRANTVLSAFKGSSWKSSDQLLPIPATEIGNNPNLGPQNPGY
jgi:hypothetical protein